MTIVIPVNVNLLPFLDKQEVRYKIAEKNSLSTTSVCIELEASAGNIMDFGNAQKKYGISIGGTLQVPTAYEYDVKPTICE